MRSVSADSLATSSSRASLIWERGWQGSCHDLCDGIKEMILFASLAQVEEVDIDKDSWSDCRRRVAHFIGSSIFSVIMTSLVVANLVIVLAEADMRAECDRQPEEECGNLQVISILDHGCTFFYVIEMALRIFVYQRYFCSSLANAFDLLVVVMCVVGAVTESVMQSASLIRLIRILRIVRVLRLLTMFQELHLMIAGLASTMRTIFWACLMLLVVFAMLSVVALEVLQPIMKEILEEREALGISTDCDRCENAFVSVEECMVTLFTTLVLGDGFLDILVPCMERDVQGAILVIGSVAFVYLGLSNLILSVIVEKANEARCQDSFYQATMARKMKQQDRQELLSLWEGIADHDSTISVHELKELWATSTTFHDYFKSMDIDRGFLEYALTSVANNSDGRVTFNEFAESVVRLKNTKVGPVAAFIKHKVTEVLKELDAVKDQCQVFQDMPKAAIENEACELVLKEVLDVKAQFSNFRQEIANKVGEDAVASSVLKEIGVVKTQLESFRQEMLKDISANVGDVVAAAAASAVVGIKVTGPQTVSSTSAPVVMHTASPCHPQLRLAASEGTHAPSKNVRQPGGASTEDSERGLADRLRNIESKLGRLVAASPGAEERVQMELAAVSGALSRAMPAGLPCNEPQMQSHSQSRGQSRRRWNSSPNRSTPVSPTPTAASVRTGDSGVPTLSRP